MLLALADPVVSRKLRAPGLQIRAMPPADPVSAVAADVARWRKVIQDAKVRAE